MNDAAVHQPSPARRGRGRGRGGAGRGGASTRARGKPAVGRRGRAKVYDHPRAQAAHERQRDLKTAYATVAAAMKPALEELADRNLDRLRSDLDAHKEVDEYTEITSFLDERLEGRLAELETERRLVILTHTHLLVGTAQATQWGYENTIDEKVDDYYDTLLRRLDLLQELFENDEPVDKPDDSYNYKSITTEEAAQQGIYCRIHNGVEVPYPQIHPELAQGANKASDPSDPNDPRTPSKRRVANQQDDEPTPKQPVTLPPGSAFPRHIGGLLSAVAPDEPPSQPASPSPAETEDDDDDEAPVYEPAPGRRGRLPRAAAAVPDETPEVEVDNNPPMPPGASEPDESGVRTITKRARGNDSGSNRIMVPALYEYDELEIGFRDSTNDPSRNGGTKAKRKQYVNTPNSNYFQFDRTVGGYDMLEYKDGDLCKETIEKHKLHPKYGVFLKTSVNEEEPPRPYVSGRKPTVFVADNGKVQHTSRSIPAAKASDMRCKTLLKASLETLVERGDITEEELHDEEYHRLVKERDERRLKQKEMENAAQQKQNNKVFASNVASLVDAAAETDRRETAKVQRPQKSQSVSPAVPRASTRPRGYDAIRDVLTGSEPSSAAPTSAAAIDNSEATGLLQLADVALRNVEAAPPTARAPISNPESGQGSLPDPATRASQQLTIQMPEPVRPNQLRDPSELEQHGGLVKYTSDNPFLPEPLAPQLPQYTPRDHGYSVQPSQVQPYINRHDSHNTSMGTDLYEYGEPEAHYGSPQLRPPSLQEDHYAPARPNTEDVAFLDPQTLVDPQLFENGQRPATSQLQAPRPEQVQQSQPPLSGGVLQQPQNSFFQTALNSPAVSPPLEHHQQPIYPEPPQAHQRFDTPNGALSRPPPVVEGSPGRTPFTHPNGTEQQPLPTLRPLQRGSGPLMAPAPQAPAPRHFMMTPGDTAEDYPQPPTGQYYNQRYQSNGFAPPEQGTRSGGYMAQPMMQTSQQVPPPPYPPYPASGHRGSQPPPQYDYVGSSTQIVQSPPPFGNGPDGPPSPSMRGGITPSSSRNKNNQYREIQPAPRMAEVEDSNGSELRTLLYNPAEVIRDYQATALPPSHGPTQIRGWTHTTGSKKSRGKNSTDSQIDPSLGQGERN
ncbi:unnamed protein product [Discula destructiva]